MSYDYGVDVVADLIPMAVELGVINKAGAWFKIVNPDTGEFLTYEPEPGETEGEVIKFQGQINLMNFLRENKVVYDFIESKVMEKINGTDMLQIDAETDRQAIIDANTDMMDDIITRPTNMEQEELIDDGPVPMEEAVFNG